jgi:hypothetical protein
VARAPPWTRGRLGGGENIYAIKTRIRRGRVLAQLIVRIFKAIANSVASERAFSAINLIYTKLRGRLGIEKANKLIFIYINQRVLDRNGDIFVGGPVEKSSKD